MPRRPTLNVSLNGQSATALWDTGSVVSLCNPDRLGLDCATAEPSPLSLKSASGHPLPLEGMLQCSVQIGNKTFQHPILLSKALASDCILGVDFMEKYNFVLDVTGRQIAQRPPVYVSLVEGCSLEAFSERMVQAFTPVQGLQLVNEINSRVPGSLGLIESCLAQEQDGQMSLVLVNPSNAMISLEKGALLASTRECSEQQVSSLEETVAVLGPGKEELKSSSAQVDLSAVPLKYRPAFAALLERYSAVINDDSTDIGRCTLLKQRITLKDPSQVACTPPYRIPPALQPIVDKFVDQLLSAGIIRKSTSPFSSPLMLIKKPHADPTKPIFEQYRVVNDFRKLNANTVRDSYPMQNLYQLIDEVASSSVASVIDLRSAFFLQELEESSRKYTSFPVPGRGLFEYCRSAQGLVNSPSTFQRLLDKLMEGLPNVRVYIDDIVVYNDSYSEHLKSLEQVLARLKAHGFKCSAKKLQLACGRLTYLGYEIAPGKSVRPGVAKCRAIAAWTPPSDIRQIRQFLGLCSFFRRTLPNFATIAKPLTLLTRKDSGYSSGELPPPAAQAFRELQRLLSTRPSLAPVRFNRPFVLTTDASSVAIGAVLSQPSTEGHEVPCAYYSRTLTDREKKLAPFHLEHVAMVAACRHFRPYLAGTKFILRTDHKPLLALNKVQGQALERLQLELEEYDFVVQYMKGKEMIADGLSRLEVDEIIPFPGSPPPTEMKKLQQNDVICKALTCAIRFGLFPSDVSLRNEVQRWARHCRLDPQGVLRLKTGQTVAPVALQDWILKSGHDQELSGHQGPTKTRQRISHTWFWPSMIKDVEAYCKACHLCNLNNMPSHSRPGPLLPLPPVTRPFERVHVDLLQLPTAPTGARYVLVMVDAFSRLVELAALTSKEAEEVAEAFLTGWVCRHGTPETLMSDLGTEFTSNVFRSLCSRLEIAQHHSSVGHPASNGRVERVNRTLLNYLRKYLDPTGDWEKRLPFASFAFNSSIHESTGVSPFFALNLHIPRLPFDIATPRRPDYAERTGFAKHRLLQKAYADIIAANEMSFAKQKQAHDLRAKGKRFQVGDRVYLKKQSEVERGKKLRNVFDGPYFIVQLKPDRQNALIRRNLRAKLTLVNIARLKLAHHGPSVDNDHDLNARPSDVRGPTLRSHAAHLASDDADSCGSDDDTDLAGGDGEGEAGAAEEPNAEAADGAAADGAEAPGTAADAARAPVAAEPTARPAPPPYRPPLPAPLARRGAMQEGLAADDVQIPPIRPRTGSLPTQPKPPMTRAERARADLDAARTRLQKTSAQARVKPKPKYKD